MRVSSLINDKIIPLNIVQRRQSSKKLIKQKSGQDINRASFVGNIWVEEQIMTI